MPVSTLVLSRFSTLHSFPASATFSSLTIDGTILVDHLVDAQLRDHLSDVCKDINSMTINFGGCGARTTGGVMDAFFEFMKTLQRLRRLEIRNFVLHNPGVPPTRPACLDRSSLSVRKLTIAHTQSACLAYLMDCIEAHEVSLECCLWIEKLPSCSRLELVNIVPFDDIMQILLEWDGDELIIESCTFIDEEFIYEVLQRMTAREKPVWPSARLSFEGYPYAIRRRLDEFLDVRSRL